MAIKCNSIGEAVMAMDKTFKMQGENDRDDASELLEYLQQLARTHGMVEVVLNNDGTFDVRAGGVSCYSKNMRAALRARAQNEIGSRRPERRPTAARSLAAVSLARVAR
jgi:hypothetical protein